MLIDHIHFYVENAIKTRNWLMKKMGFQFFSQMINEHTHTEIVTYNHKVFFLISSALNNTSPVFDYLNKFTSGIADVAFQVKNIDRILDQLSNFDRTHILNTPQTYLFAEGELTIAKVKGWNSLEHTLIQNNTTVPSCHLLSRLKENITTEFPSRKDNQSTNNQDKNNRHWQKLAYKRQLPLLPGMPKSFSQMSNAQNLPSLSLNSDNNNRLPMITGIDHVVLNVAKGKLTEAVEFYQNVFDFKTWQKFKIKTDKSGLSSKALISANNNFYFNINEPTSSNSQIQMFLDANGGSGIQHLALATNNIINIVSQMHDRGLDFLTINDRYYTQLKKYGKKGVYPILTATEWEQIRQQKILIDFELQNSAALLMQIFTQPIFNQPTFFFELIERRKQSQGFGEGNFQALFELIEQQLITNN